MVFLSVFNGLQHQFHLLQSTFGSSLAESRSDWESVTAADNLSAHGDHVREAVPEPLNMQKNYTGENEFGHEYHEREAEPKPLPLNIQKNYTLDNCADPNNSTCPFIQHRSVYLK